MRQTVEILLAIGLVGVVFYPMIRDWIISRKSINKDLEADFKKSDEDLRQAYFRYCKALGVIPIENPTPDNIKLHIKRIDNENK